MNVLFRNVLVFSIYLNRAKMAVPSTNETTAKVEATAATVAKKNNCNKVEVLVAEAKTTQTVAAAPTLAKEQAYVVVAAAATITTVAEAYILRAVVAIVVAATTTVAEAEAEAYKPTAIVTIVAVAEAAAAATTTTTRKIRKIRSSSNNKQHTRRSRSHILSTPSRRRTRSLP